MCDAYDAITSDRCYRKARSSETARQELLREAGHQFDPEVVEAFLKEVDELESSQATGGPEGAHQHAREVADRLLGILEPQTASAPSGC